MHLPVLHTERGRESERAREIVSIHICIYTYTWICFVAGFLQYPMHAWFPIPFKEHPPGMPPFVFIATQAGANMLSISMPHLEYKLASFVPGPTGVQSVLRSFLSCTVGLYRVIGWFALHLSPLKLSTCKSNLDV